MIPADTLNVLRIRVLNSICDCNGIYVCQFAHIGHRNNVGRPQFTNDTSGCPDGNLHGIRIVQNLIHLVLLIQKLCIDELYRYCKIRGRLLRIVTLCHQKPEEYRQQQRHKLDPQII